MRARHVLNSGAKVDCDRLRLVKFSFFGFDGKIHHDGEMVVMDAVASHVLRVFVKLRGMRFPIQKARPMNEFDGDDNASMRENNSSAFNDRSITGRAVISLHAYGLAIDLNPIQNPYLVRSGEAIKIEPLAGGDYVNRLNDRPWKQQRSGMVEPVVRVFADEGFLMWGGYWDDPVDYQHFQVGQKLAEQLAGSSPAVAARKFDQVVRRFRACQRRYRPQTLPSRNCVEQADPTAKVAAKLPR
jgi:hypothetical protein